MALTLTALDTTASATDATSYASASVSPSAGDVLVVAQSRQAAGTPATPTASGNSLTWTQLGTYNPATAATRRITMFRGRGTATTGAVTVSFGGTTQTQCILTVIQASGLAQLVGSLVGNSGGAPVTSLTVTLPAFSSADNIALGCICHLAAEATTPGSGFTELADAMLAENMTGYQVEYKQNDNTVDASWATAALPWGAAVELAEEIVLASGGLPLLGVG